MISIQQLQRFFLITSLAVSLATIIAFQFGTTDSWATTSLAQLISQPQTQITTMNRAKSVAKSMEGKAQEVIGNITGDFKDQFMGKAKQLEGQAGNAVEDVKETIRDILK
jgi:uncharacterized protein YjbJ (UPF0337 family)